MEAGRELDALVAEKIMGWTPKHGMFHGLIMDHFVDERGTTHAINCGCVEDFHPSTSIADAWRVVEQLDAQNITTEIDKREAGWAVAFIDYSKPPVVRTLDRSLEIADTAPLAICLAALNAMEVAHGQ